MAGSHLRQRLAELDWKRIGLETGFWLLFAAIFWSLSIFSKIQEYQSSGRSVDLVAILIKECSSAIAALLLLLWVRWWLDRHPISNQKLLQVVGWHSLGAILFSISHVLIFMLLRSSAFWMMGREYDPATGEGLGGLLRMFAYEFSQDLPLYLAMILIISLYRRWRDSHEAGQATADYPEIILASLGSKDKALKLAEVEWIQAAGNYVSLFSRGQEYLLRSTMASLEKKLKPEQFQRVHRSYMVNIAVVDLLRTSESGQPVLITKTGQEIPLSRSYRSQLLQRLSLPAD